MPLPEVETQTQEFPTFKEQPKNNPNAWTIAKHVGLFIATFICVSLVGIFWVGQSAEATSYLDMWQEGVLFASLLLAFLATHEFGHYFAAVHHNVRVTLPYFIPIPLGIGTMGAVIKIEEQIQETKKLFDIGIAGPVAGFIVSLIVLLYGFSTLPEPTFIENFAGHEEVISQVYETGSYPETPPEIENAQEGTTIMLGNTLLYSLLASFFENVPPMYEMYHYPFLFAGWLGLFFTALNLTPIGQLDGGHILYSLIGYKDHRTVARICFGFIATLGGIEAIPFLSININGWLPGYGFLSILLWALVLLFLCRKAFHSDHVWIAPLWAVSLITSVAYLYFTSGFDQSGSLIWVFWSFFLVYFVKIEHPPVLFERPLTPWRNRLGWISMAVFVLCISPTPIYFVN